MPYVYAAIAAYTVISGLSNSKKQKEQAKRNREIAEFNAKLIEKDALDTEKFGYTQSSRYLGTIDAVIGNQRTALAAANVDVSQGTAAAIQEESKNIGFLNALDIERQARLKAQKLRQQASLVRQGGQMAYQQGQMDANATATASVINAANTAVTGYYNANPPKGS
jgi:hypothetical protein